MSGRLKHLKEEKVSLPASKSQNVEIEPLSGKPFFHMLILKSHVNSPYNLAMPAKFSRVLPVKEITVVLHYGSKSWIVSYYGNHPTHKRFDTRWRVFAEDNKLKIGDICIFELMECEDTLLKFKVQVLRGDFPSVLLDRLEGSPNNPVVIDDD